MITVAMGSSMLPTFGTINLIKITKKKSYKINDIISLRGKDKNCYCHRIQEINDFFVSTKGDNLEQQEYEKDVSIKNIEGLVTVLWRIKG